ESNDVTTRGQTFSHGRLALQTERSEVHERAAPEVLDQGDLVRAREPGELIRGGPRGEAGDAEIAAVHAQDHRRVPVLLERARVVLQVRAVGGPDLDQRGAAL